MAGCTRFFATFTSTTDCYGLLLELTGSAEAVAWAVVLRILPFFLASPTAGAVNDRVSRRRVMIATDLLRSLVVLGMLFIEREEKIGLLYLLLGVEVVRDGQNGNPGSREDRHTEK